MKEIFWGFSNELCVCFKTVSYYTFFSAPISSYFKVKPFHLGSETIDVAVVGVDRAGDGHIQSYTVAVLRGTLNEFSN